MPSIFTSGRLFKLSAMTFSSAHWETALYCNLAVSREGLSMVPCQKKGTQLTGSLLIWYDLIFQLTSRMMEEGRCLLDLQRAHPRKGYGHFGGHETKFRPGLRPSDGKSENGPEISHKADEIEGGPASGSQTPDGLQRPGQQPGGKRSRAVFDEKWNRLWQ